MTFLVAGNEALHRRSRSVHQSCDVSDAVVSFTPMMNDELPNFNSRILAFHIIKASDDIMQPSMPLSAQKQGTGAIECIVCM